MAVPKGKDEYVDCFVEKVLITNQGGVVLLGTHQDAFADKVLPVFVDVGQAMNIQMSLAGHLPPRPFTHDLMTTILNEMGAMVVELTIDELAQNTFFATVGVELEKNGGRQTEKFDARPSDGISLALRADAPIRVKRHVMDEACITRKDFFEGRGGGAPTPAP